MLSWLAGTSKQQAKIKCLICLPGCSASAGPITAATLPGIERLTALQDLSLYSCELEPSCLLPMTTGLTRLYLENLTLLPQLDGTLGTSQLLEVLEWLPALRVLGLVGIAGGWPQQQQELSAYSALTASTDLQELHIYDCNFPAAAWAHVFPAGLWLPHLHTFKGCRSDDRTAPGPSSFNSTAIQHLASCCPGLTDVHIDVYASVSLAPLPALLTALTRLRIGPVKPADIIWHLEPLSQLQDLSVSDMARYPGCWEDPSTNQYSLPLTALRNLTRLSYTLEVGSPDHEASITSKVSSSCCCSAVGACNLLSTACCLIRVG
jgi:hypothetical protein